jgi:hypothetical protein
MKPSEELRELRERVATLERERDNPRGNPRNPEASPAVVPAVPAVVPAAVSAQASPQLDSRDVRRLLRDLEEVNNFLDQGDAEAAQGELDEIVAGIEASADNGDDDD